MTPARRLLSILVPLMLLAVPARAQEADPHAALRGKLSALIRVEDFAGALRLADEAIAADEACIPGWQYRAYALHRLGRKAEAHRAYVRTVELAPENWWAWLNLGELLASQNRLDEAIRTMKEAARLNPSSADVWMKLSQVHRERTDYMSAVVVARKALETGADPAWCHAELGYLYFALEQQAKSRSHWRMARASGADGEACGHAEKLLEWEKPTGSKREQLEISRRRQGEGEHWIYNVGCVEVFTRVGPKLPRDVERLVAEIEKGHRKLLGLDKVREGAIRLILSRTYEEHEVHRMREFPAGYSGKGFCVQRGGQGGRPGGRPGRGGRWRTWSANVGIYVAWSEPGLEKSLSHELAHAFMRVKRAVDPPTWLDEGIATYLEHVPDRRGRLVSGGARADYLEALAQAETDGSALTFDRLLAAPRTDFYGPFARARYAQAWSIVHFLVTAQPKGARRLQGLLGRVGSRGGFLTAADLATEYGKDLSILEKEWKRHLAKLRED